jgi:hypothetical protein
MLFLEVTLAHRARSVIISSIAALTPFESRSSGSTVGESLVHTYRTDAADMEA